MYACIYVYIYIHIYNSHPYIYMHEYLLKNLSVYNMKVDFRPVYANVLHHITWSIKVQYIT